jgi:hypothetical protein
MRMLLCLFGISFGVATSGCLADPPKLDSENGIGTVGNLLSKELVRFGCTNSFQWASLPTNQVRWVAHRDRDGAYLYIEGNYTKAMLEDIKKVLGEPAIMRGESATRAMSFVYAKSQCGVMIDCRTEPMSIKGVLTGPLTVVGFHQKLDDESNVRKARSSEIYGR